MHRRSPPDYEGIELRYWKGNAGEVVERLSKEDDTLLKRVHLFHERFGYSKEEIKDKIKDDPMFAAHFAIEPRRQNIHETIALLWLQQVEGIENCEKLPGSGKNAIYVTSDGEIRPGKEFNKKPPSKSMDFRWKTGDTTFYATHKYTKEGGGNQDSQYKEVKELLDKFLKCEDESCALVAIVDGAYYTPKKMGELLSRTRDHSPKSYACQIDGIQDIIPGHL